MFHDKTHMGLCATPDYRDPGYTNTIVYDSASVTSRRLFELDWWWKMRESVGLRGLVAELQISSNKLIV